MIKRFIMLAVVLGSALPVHAQYFLRQSTASQEMLIGPFLDDTDGKTAETGLTIANTDVKLWKRGATSESNKNSGGATHVAAGRYYIVLDDTDTNTLGELELNVHVAGALPIQKRCIVLPANVFDSVVLGSDKLDTNAAELGGTAQTGRDVGASVLVSVGSGAGQINVSSGKVPATIAVGDIATGAVTADAIAADAVGSSELAATAVDEIVDATWDEPYSGHTTAGTPGQAIPTLAKLDTAIALDGAVYRFTANALELAPTGGLDAAAIRAALGLASANLDTQLGAIDDYVDTEVAAILADTGTDGVKVDAASAATAVWNAATATYGTSGSYGEALEAVGSAADPWLTNLPGAYGAGTAGYRIGTYLDAAISSRASQTSVDTVDDLLDTEVAAILADTNELQTDWVDGGRLDLLVDAVKLVLDHLATAIELDGAVYRFTTNALEQAPSAGGTGGISWTLQVNTSGNVPIPDCRVWVTTDSAGANKVAGPVYTNASGQVTLLLDAGTYYAWRMKYNVTFTNPQSFTVTAP